ncbi:MAG: hypothetical protein AAFQ87_01940 [Bacteroidota bacterium]
MKSQKPIHFSWGSPFHQIIPWIGYFFLLFGGYILLMHQNSTGWLALLMGFVLGVLREGVSLDPANGQFRSYWSALGIKMGSWKPLDKYPYLVLLRSKTKFSSGPLVRGVPLPDTSFSQVTFDLYLMSRNHLKRELITISTDQEKAKEMARDLAEDLGVEFVAYNPGQIVHQKRF